MDDILRLLDELQMIAVDDPRTLIGKFSYGLDKEEVVMQISKVRSALPEQLRNASRNVRESEELKKVAQDDAQITLEAAKKEAERIINDAKVESEKILELGRVQQDRMVADSEILKLSKAQAEQIRNEAESEAKRIRLGADQYASDVLGKLENNVDKIASAVKNSRAELAKIETSGQAVVRTNERIRV